MTTILREIDPERQPFNHAEIPMPSGDAPRSELGNISTDLWTIRDILDDIRKDQSLFFERMISLMEKMLSAVEKIELEGDGNHLDFDRIAVATENSAISLRELEGRFAPEMDDHPLNK